MFVIEICFEEAITRRRCFGRGGKIYSNGCRFADDLIRRVHNEDASLSLSYSVSSSLSSKCMPMWTSVVAMFRSFKNTQDKEPSSNTDEVIKIIVASNFITEAARRPAVLIIRCDDNDCFLYMSLQLFAMHKPRLQAPSDYISVVFDSLDPWPQYRSCSFRFK